MFKKIYTFFIIIIFILISVITVNGVLIPLQKTGDGGTLYYKGTTDPVLINSTYEYSESEFRGVWITPLAGNIPRYTSQSQYKSVMTQVFDNMEQYNLNVLIYHVRIMNDAFYDSEFNNWSSYYSTNPDWEALSWIIDEAHKRGIEFHAWMNPYRITNSYSGTVESYASSVSNKKNAASNPDNILKSGSKLILNPGEPTVRNFLVDTVEELVTNYDVDAIHFDDYFYIDGVDDSSTRAKYNPNNLGVADWRREQVDLFIHELKDYLDVYNQENNKHVELGISPSGIWQNGDGIVTYDSEGNAITTGSKTGGMEHNNNYLYSNTVNWVNHEWIDYILPQSYWGFEHPVAGFADVMGWWNKVVKYKNVNLYSGIGIYMAESSSNTYSWQNNPEEMKNMMLYLNTLENVKGFSLYSYAHLEKAINSSKSNHILFKNLFNNAYNVAWTENVLLPEKIAGPKINPGTVTNVNLINDGTRNILSWDSNTLAKYYAIYKNDGEITYDNSELFDVVLASTTEVESYSDVEASNYHYAVLPLSYSNTTGQGVEVVSDGQVTTYKVEFYDASGTVIKTQYVEENSSASAPVDPLKQGYTFTGWDKDFNIITDNLKVYPEYEINTYTVTFKINGDIISTQDIVYNNSAISPNPIEIEGYSFIKWDKDFTNVSSDLIINAVYEVKLYLIEYYDGTTLLKSEYVEHGKNGNAPLPPEKIGLDFLSWDKEFSNVTENLEIYAIYSDAIYEVKFFVDGIQEGPVQYVNHGKDAIAPEVSKPGYGFVSWDKELTNITKNTNIYAIFSDEIFQVKFFVNDKLVKTYVALYGEKIENPDVNIEGIIILTWDQEFDYITKSMNINAIYEVKTFTVIYKANDVVIKTETVEYGKDGIAPEVPIIEGYEFDKWDSNYENVTEDLLINAQYKRSIYSVIFKHNNKVISSQEVYYGENGVAPVLELQTGYKFIEWSNSFNNIKEDLIIEAIVEQEIYTVIFYDLDDNILTSVEVLAGEEAIAPNAVEINGKTFSKWDKDFDAVFEDLEIRPIYTDVIEIEDNAKCSSFNIFQVISVFMAFGLIVLFRKKY